MNNTIRKALTVLAGVAVSAAMLATGAAPALAAEPVPAPVAFTPQELGKEQTLTVTSGVDLTGKTLKAVRLAGYAAGTYTGDTITGYDVNDGGHAQAIDTALKNNGFFNNEAGKQEIPADYDAANPMGWIAQNLLDSQTSPWAGKLRDLLTILGKDQTVTGDKNAVALTPSQDKLSLTANVTPGIYLIVDTTTTSATNGASIPMLTGTGINGLTKLGEGDKQVTLGSVAYKGIVPDISKKVLVNSQPADSAAAKIGDTVTYRLTVTVPNWTGYDKYRLTVSDTLSKGLTFGQVSKFDLTADGVAADKLYKQDGPVANKDDASSTITFTFAPDANDGGKSNILQYKNVFTPGKQFTIEYTATINKDAVTGSATNHAQMKYSNNPNDPDSLGVKDATPGDTPVTVYIGRVLLVKHDATGKPLAGAKFTLKDGQNALQLVQDNAGSDTAEAVYHLADATELADDKTAKTAEVTTPASGKITVNGLNGALNLVETYSPLGTPALPTAGLTVTPGKTNKVEVTTPDANKLVTANGETVTVVNVRNLLEMPKTGAAWMGIYTAGFVMCALGAGILLRKRNA